MANNVTKIIHKIRNPKETSHWLSDWTAEIETIGENEEEDVYTITPSKNWKIPFNQIIIENEEGSEISSSPVQISNPNEAIGIPIIANSTIIDKRVFDADDNTNTFISRNGTWKKINLDISDRQSLTAGSTSQIKMVKNVSGTVGNFSPTLIDSVTGTYTLIIPNPVIQGIQQEDQVKDFQLNSTMIN